MMNLSAAVSAPESVPDDWNCPDCGVTKADFYCFDD